MGKYEPLTTFLSGAGADEVPMSFTEIEEVIGGALPSSKRHPAWWSNNAANNVMTRAWLAAGFRTERVNTSGERLVFRRTQPVEGSGAGRPLTLTPGLLARVREALGGSVTIRPGVDVTAPTGEAWDAEA